MAGGVGSPGPALKTIGALLLLLVALPGNLLLTMVALVRGVWVKPQRRAAFCPVTVLVSGGKMTKALQLARSFHASGHRVVLVESTTTGIHIGRNAGTAMKLPPGTISLFAAKPSGEPEQRLTTTPIIGDLGKNVGSG